MTRGRKPQTGQAEALDLGPAGVPRPDPAPEPGAATAAIQLTLAAWAAVGYLTGDDHAATRQTLLDGALAVDVAVATLERRPTCQVCRSVVKGAWVSTPAHLAVANQTLAQLLSAVMPAQDADGPDPYGLGGDDDGPAFRIPDAWISDATPGNTMGE